MRIGNTPLVAINYKYKNESRTIYAKLEMYNQTGSVKDRMANYIIKQAKKDGSLKPGMTIIEATSGNTGIAFSALGKLYGHNVEIFMPDWMSQERVDIMKSYGATIHLVSAEQGGFLGSIELANKRAEEIGGFRPQQFDSDYNWQAHFNSTAPEIVEALAQIKKVPDAFVAGVGTAGTLMGVTRYLKEVNPSVKCHALEPANSPTITTGHKVGKHRIQGISDEFIPNIYKADEVEECICADDGDSIIMAQQLARKFGLGVGISSGANFIGAVKLQNMYGSNSTVVTIFSDCNKKYLSTDLVKEEPVCSSFLSADIELESIEIIGK